MTITNASRAGYDAPGIDTTRAGAATGRRALLEGILFMGLSLLLAGSAVLAASTLGPGLQFVLALGPAGIALALAWRGRTVRRLLAGTVRRPADHRWYLALVIPVAGSLAVVPVGMALGLPNAGLFGNLTPTALIIPLVVLIPAFTEELGWRGYALPRILTRVSPLAAGLLIAAPWAVMHLGLYLPGQPYEGTAVWPSIVTVTALSVLGTWLFIHTGGSVLMTGLFHAAFNAATSLTWSLEPDAAWAIRPVVFAVIAAAVVLLGGLRAPSPAKSSSAADRAPAGTSS